MTTILLPQWTGNNWGKSQRFQFLLTRSQARELAEFLREQV